MGKQVSSGVKAAPGLGPFDKRILQLLSERKSPEEISFAIGGLLTPAQCAARGIEILESHDFLEVLNQKRLVVENATWISSKLKSQIESMDYIDKDSAGVYMKSLNDIMKMIDGMNFEDEASMMRVREVHARVMVAAIRVAFEKALLELQKRHPEIEEAEAYEVLESAMPLAVNSLADDTNGR